MRLPNGQETISVGELHKALEGVSDFLPVDVFVEPGFDGPDGYNVIDAMRHPESGISYETFSLHVRKGFYF